MRRVQQHRGRSLQIASDTVIRLQVCVVGDGNDTIIANDLGDTIQSGRGTGRRNGRDKARCFTVG
jgi:hypothetical protein